MVAGCVIWYVDTMRRRRNPARRTQSYRSNKALWSKYPCAERDLRDVYHRLRLSSLSERAVKKIVVTDVPLSTRYFQSVAWVLEFVLSQGYSGKLRAATSPGATLDQ